MAEVGLRGRRLLVTRRPEQSGELVARLRERGAEVLELPTLVIVPPLDSAALDATLRTLADFDWLALTSANTVAAVAARLRALALAPAPERAPRGASVGPATTSAAAAELGFLRIALEPERDYRAEGLLRAFESHELQGRRVLLPLSERARDVLAAGLRARGAVVETPVAYRTVAPPGLAASFAAALDGGLDLALFASPSAVENLRDAAPQRVVGLPCAVIGPVTEAAARACGLDVQAVAQPASVDGLLRALERRFGL